MQEEMTGLNDAVLGRLQPCNALKALRSGDAIIPAYISKSGGSFWEVNKTVNPGGNCMVMFLPNVNLAIKLGLFVIKIVKGI